MSAALALGGCASNSTQSSDATRVYSAQMANAGRVDIEDDGLPAQAPPAMRNRAMPDDPSEPFSRNYGGSNPAAAATPLPVDAEPAAAPAENTPHDIPHDLPADFRRKLVGAVAQAD